MTWILTNAVSAQEHFERHPEETEFVKYLGDLFQVTYAGRYKTNVSEYSYYLLRPHEKPASRYGLSGEILALYAPYGELQARSLKDIADLQYQYKERAHPVWTILISDDHDVVAHLADLSAGKDLDVYCIPFSRNELAAKPKATELSARLERYIYGRDLFAVQSPVQNDTLFFGRKSLVDTLIGQIESGQNFGLFGLRKSGKTSVLLAVERYLERLGGYRFIHIDCQNPAIYLMRWHSLLGRVCRELGSQDFRYQTNQEQVEQFERLIRESPLRTVLVFDEIENISVDLSPESHWNEDFLPFWSAIRAIHQTSHGKLTFGVAGVNQYIFDLPLVQGRDNPILLGVSPKYLQPLESGPVREMVRTIGRYMGLAFSEDVYPWLFQQFGGHPFLVRKACSLVIHQTKKQTGDEVSVEDFRSRQAWLDDQLGKDILNILVVLAQHYPDEYDNLCLLANGDREWIQQVRVSDSRSLTHIIGYRVVQETENGYSFVIQAMARFLVASGGDLKTAVKVMTKGSTPTTYEELPNPSQLDLWARIGKARNQVEPALRSLLHRALLYKYGEKRALQLVLDKFSPERRLSLNGYTLAQIFRGDSKSLYLKDVKEICLREWDLVQHVFGNDRKAFENKVDTLNSDGRADAHANPVDASVVSRVETIADELLQQIRPFVE